MIVLSKREKETLREISQWSCFYANWKPKTDEPGGQCRTGRKGRELPVNEYGARAA